MESDAADRRRVKGERGRKEMKRSERNAKKKLTYESCKITTSQGRGRLGDRLALDDSAIDGHTKIKKSAKVEISQRAGGNAAPSVLVCE